MFCAAGERKGGGNSPLATSGQFATPNTKDRDAASLGGSRSGFPKSSRLLKRAEFQRVYDADQRISSKWFNTFLLPRDDAKLRVGLTTPRALGKSVERNRIKRRMREAIRLELGRLNEARAKGADLVIHPRRPVLEVDFGDLRREVERVLRKCGLS